MTYGGFVPLWREILENGVWTTCTPATLKVWMAFKLSANWRDDRWYDGRQYIPLVAGSFVTSYGRMADLCQLTVKQVRTAMKHIAKLGLATYRTTAHYTIVTITDTR